MKTLKELNDIYKKQNVPDTKIRGWLISVFIILVIIILYFFR